MRRIILSSVLAALILPVQALALGLGTIEVSSQLNQKLDARISLLSAQPADAEVLIVKLASREEFVKAGLDRPFSLTSLKFKTLVEDDDVYITVTSPSPIREPTINFLVEVDWPQGQLLREYTILLDPPALTGQK